MGYWVFAAITSAEGSLGGISGFGEYEELARAREIAQRRFHADPRCIRVVVADRQKRGTFLYDESRPALVAADPRRAARLDDPTEHFWPAPYDVAALIEEAACADGLDTAEGWEDYYKRVAYAIAGWAETLNVICCPLTLEERLWWRSYREGLWRARTVL